MSIKLLILSFDKAEEEVGSSKKTHRAQHLSDVLQENYKYQISERTLRDYYTNYKKGIIGFQDDLKPKLIACLCSYLGYKDYADFVNQSQHETPEDPEGKKRRLEEIERKKEEEERKKQEEIKKRKRKKLVITISIAFGAILTITQIFKNQIFPGDLSLPSNNETIENPVNSNKKTIDNPINSNIDAQLAINTCMTWADSLFIKVACDEGPLSKFGTKVEPMIVAEFKNMRKVKVDLAYQFFTDTGKPLIWYHKNENNEHEYFTAPGLHPVDEETLRKITPYIIQTYVPMHLNKKESFAPE